MWWKLLGLWACWQLVRFAALGTLWRFIRCCCEMNKDLTSLHNDICFWFIHVCKTFVLWIVYQSRMIGDCIRKAKANTGLQLFTWYRYLSFYFMIEYQHKFTAKKKQRIFSKNMLAQHFFKWHVIHVTTAAKVHNYVGTWFRHLSFHLTISYRQKTRQFTDFNVCTCGNRKNLLILTGAIGKNLLRDESNRTGFGQTTQTTVAATHLALRSICLTLK